MVNILVRRSNHGNPKMILHQEDQVKSQVHSPAETSKLESQLKNGSTKACKRIGKLINSPREAAKAIY